MVTVESSSGRACKSRGPFLPSHSNKFLLCLLCFFLIFQLGKITEKNSAHSKAHSPYWVCSKSLCTNTARCSIEQSSFWAWLKWHCSLSVLSTPAKYTILGAFLDCFLTLQSVLDSVSQHNRHSELGCETGTAESNLWYSCVDVQHNSAGWDLGGLQWSLLNQFRKHTSHFHFTLMFWF